MSEPDVYDEEDITLSPGAKKISEEAQKLEELTDIFRQLGMTDEAVKTEQEMEDVLKSVEDIDKVAEEALKEDIEQKTEEGLGDTQEVQEEKELIQDVEQDDAYIEGVAKLIEDLMEQDKEEEEKEVAEAEKLLAEEPVPIPFEEETSETPQTVEEETAKPPEGSDLFEWTVPTTTESSSEPKEEEFRSLPVVETTTEPELSTTKSKETTPETETTPEMSSESTTDVFELPPEAEDTTLLEPEVKQTEDVSGPEETTETAGEESGVENVVGNVHIIEEAAEETPEESSTPSEEGNILETPVEQTPSEETNSPVTLEESSTQETNTPAAEEDPNTKYIKYVKFDRGEFSWDRIRVTA